MFIRNIIFLVVFVTSPYQAYGMKRDSSHLDLAITMEETNNQNLFNDIQQNLYNFDAFQVYKLISTKEASSLSIKQKNDLLEGAKNLKKEIVQMEKLGNNIAKRTDNEVIKHKFSYNMESENLKKISRNFYALKTLPSLKFPRAIFTPMPLFDYYKKESDQRIQPDQCLVALIKNEQTAIRICCFHITLPSIANALIKKAKKNISVEVITDKEQGKNEKDYQVIKTLLDNGISVLSPQNNLYEAMHHKFFIFDSNLGNKNLLWTGSYNPTQNGNSNSWDDAIIFDDEDVIEEYNNRFEDIKSKSSPYTIAQATLPASNNLQPNSNNNISPNQPRQLTRPPQTRTSPQPSGAFQK